MEQCTSVAPHETTVLLSGETGTGKEICARAIHELSQHASGSFIPVDCASLPEALFANELFGHDRGAFTDAHETKQGLLSLAEGGTFFLDEVESLSFGSQGVLLRLLENRTWRPLGSQKFYSLKCRVIAATNQDLLGLVLAKTFRPDLYYRLSVNVISLPPLKERREDIPLLVQHFLSQYGPTYQKEGIHLSKEGIETLSDYSFPGNVRELQNILQQAIIRTSGSCIKTEDLQVPSTGCKYPSDCSWSEARRQALLAWEKEFLSKMLSTSSGNISEMSRKLKLSRQVLYRLLKRHNLKPPSPNETPTPSSLYKKDQNPLKPVIK
jgi:two-component system response regulator GlrR